MKRRRTIYRPRNVDLGDKRCPLLRLLHDCNSGGRGMIEPDYAQQWPTFFKAQRLGYIDDRSYITESGKDFVRQKSASRPMYDAAIPTPLRAKDTP